MHAAVRLLLPLVLLALAACRQPSWDTPEAAYSSFSQALQRGEYQLAYQALSSESRRALESRSKQISAASGGAVRDEPWLLAFATGAKPRPLTSVKVVSQDERSAVISAAADEQTAQVRMVKEGDRWRVDLSETLKE